MLFNGAATTGAYGQSDLGSVEDQDLFWGIEPAHSIYHIGYETLASTTVDSGNPDGTNHLRSGLVLGQITASKLLTHWDPTATDGSEVPRYILMTPTNIAPYGTAASGQHPMRILSGGRLFSDKIIVPGSASRGITQSSAWQWVLANALSQRFILDRTLKFDRPGGIQNVTANRTLTAAETGGHFENTGATGGVTVTLPTAVRGLEFSFFRSTAQTFTISGVITDTSGTSQTSIALSSTIGYRFVARNVAGTIRWVATAL